MRFSRIDFSGTVSSKIVLHRDVLDNKHGVVTDLSEDCSIESQDCSSDDLTMRSPAEIWESWQHFRSAEYVEEDAEVQRRWIIQAIVKQNWTSWLNLTTVLRPSDSSFLVSPRLLPYCRV